MTNQMNEVFTSEVVMWPITFINVNAWYGDTKKNAICYECYHNLTWDQRHEEPIESLTYNSTGRHSYDGESVAKVKSEIKCTTCGKLVVGVKPNPYTIPELPNLGDVKFSWSMSKALDNCFTDAYVFHNMQVWMKKNAGKEPTYEQRHAFYAYPSFYVSHKNWLENVTFQNVTDIKKVLNEYLDGLTSKVTTGISTNAGSAKMNIKKLLTELDKWMTRALSEGIDKREDAIATARKSALHYGDRAAFDIRLVEDANGNRGILRVGAFDTTPRASGWVNSYPEWSQDIDVYVSVQDNEAMMRFEQDQIVPDYVRDGFITTDLDEAIAFATTQLQARIDARYDDTDVSAIYAVEALRAAGIALTDDQEVVNA